MSFMDDILEKGKDLMNDPGQIGDYLNDPSKIISLLGQEGRTMYDITVNWRSDCHFVFHCSYSVNVISIIFICWTNKIMTCENDSE